MTKKKDHTIATTLQLAYRWGVTRKTINEWANAWLKPALVGNGRYDDRIAHQLYVDSKVIPKLSPSDDGESMDQARRRKEVALANIKELDEQERRGELIQRDDAVQWVGSLVDEARSAFLATPRRLAPVIYGKDIRQAEVIIRQEITRVLNKLARPIDEKKQDKGSERRKGKVETTRRPDRITVGRKA